MKNTLRFLALAASFALLLAACDSSSGGTLTPDSGGSNNPDVVTGDPDGGTNPGDDTATSPGDDTVTEPGDTTTATGGVAGLQNSTLSIECDPSTAFVNHPDTRTFEGLVVVSPRFEAADGLWGYYVAEASGAWHGVKLVVPEALDGDYAIGDELTVTGEGVDYYCNTQFKALQAPVVTGEGVALPTPVDVAPETLAPSGTDGEAYEGVRVRLSNVTVESTASWGFTLQDSAVEISDSLFQTGVRPAAGCAVDTIIGIVEYAFESYQIIPISADDISYDADDPSCAAPACAFETISAYQQSDASANCTAEGSQDIDGGADCSYEGLVVISEQVYVSSNLRGHYVMDPAGGAWSGILVKFFKDDAPELSLGDVISVTGDIQEYFCLSQLNAAAPAEDLTTTGTADLPAAEALTAGDLDESWEGVRAVFSDEVVAEVPSDANHWQVTFDSGLRIEDAVSYHYDDFAFEVGQSFATITGTVAEDTYNPGTYFVLPNSAAELVLSTK